MPCKHRSPARSKSCIAARKRGFTAKGLMLTQKGLSEQKLPLIAVVFPGHYVIVESVKPDRITVWEPGERREARAELTSS